MHILAHAYLTQRAVQCSPPPPNINPSSEKTNHIVYFDSINSEAQKMSQKRHGFFSP